MGITRIAQESSSEQPGFLIVCGSYNIHDKFILCVFCVYFDEIEIEIECICLKKNIMFHEKRQSLTKIDHATASTHNSDAHKWWIVKI